MSLNNSWIVKYYQEIKSGNIIVGHEIIQEYEKLFQEITDEEYQKENNIIIELEESEKRIKFIETRCKHFQAPFAGKPFILELFQKAIVEAIFAIKIYDEEAGRYVRKYSEVLLVIARKNGKTPLIAAICLAEWFCGPLGTNILCASNDFDQADLLFQAINSMREESKLLEGVTRKNLKGMFFGNPRQKKKKGKFSQQNKGHIKKLSAKSGAKEGRNILVGAVDEVHEMEDNSTIMPVRQALSTQDEPLFFELTTEGFVNGGYLDERIAKARRILNGEEINERMLILLYTQDNEQEVWQDETSWVKSNPGLGVIKKRSFLRAMIEDAKTSTSDKAFVLAKDFNIKQNNAQAWLQKEWIENDLTYDIEDFMGWVGIGGVDLSENNDLTCAKVLFEHPQTRIKITLSMYFLPVEHMGENAKYDEWAKQGYLRYCEGSQVEDQDIINWFIELYKRYKIYVFKTGYDKWQAKGFKTGMEDIGYELERINQGYDLSTAMNVVESDLKQNKLNYNQNPVDTFCYENTSAKWNSSGTKRMPVKVQGDITKKIDGAVVTLICYETLDRYRKEYRDIAMKKNKLSQSTAK